MVGDSTPLIAVAEKNAGCGAAGPYETAIYQFDGQDWGRTVLADADSGVLLSHDALDQPVLVWDAPDGIHLIRHVPE